MREKADMEREKVKETDKLRKDMDNKITETQHSLHALKKVQLETTTRLTVLQNHQLTNELEYQSKQTEKLLSKNQKLQDMVVSLKRDVDIHKQVETELAQKSQNSQGMINKLSDKVKVLEQDKETLADSLKEKQEMYNKIYKDDLDATLFDLEKELNQSSKTANHLQREFDRIKNENYQLTEQINKLHEAEPTV